MREYMHTCAWMCIFVHTRPHIHYPQQLPVFDVPEAKQICGCCIACPLPCRVLLPINFESGRGVVLGEGKPENQNHAIVFCPGEALQTIDCNQDNIVAEGLKLRNLLAELLPRQPDTIHCNSQHKQVALVGFREWVFSQDSGALAEFAAATERSFGTTIQRLMYNPGAFSCIPLPPHSLLVPQSLSLLLSLSLCFPFLSKASPSCLQLL